MSTLGERVPSCLRSGGRPLSKYNSVRPPPPPPWAPHSRAVGRTDHTHACALQLLPCPFLFAFLLQFFLFIQCFLGHFVCIAGPTHALACLMQRAAFSIPPFPFPRFFYLSPLGQAACMARAASGERPTPSVSCDSVNRYVPRSSPRSEGPG